MNRIDRLHAILTQLQSKKLVKAQEIADRFHISLRTVYRDVKALEESGIPIIGEAGSGYSMMEGYRLPPVMFTQEEASALLLGSKLAAQLTDASVQKHYEEALYKIKAVLRTGDKDYVDELSNNIEIVRPAIPQNENTNRHLTALQKAIAEKAVVFIRYSSSYNKTETTERLVEPIGLVHYSQAWHLIGWCRLRNGYRDFKVNRIERLQLKEESFGYVQHKSLQEYLQSIVNTSGLQETAVLFDKEVTRFMNNTKYYYGFVREEDAGDAVKMYFLTAHLEVLGRWLLGFTNAVQIESPGLLKEIMKELTDELKAHYQP
jgi:predicted DNA-binding transcriptional regulator YafY